MQQIVENSKVTFLSKDFATCLAEMTDLPFFKIEQIGDLALSCLLLGISKQVTHAIGRQLTVNKVLNAGTANEREDYSTAGTIHEMALEGDKLLGAILPGQKSSLVGIIISHTKIRAATASLLVSIMTYILIQQIRKEAQSRRWDRQELSVFLYKSAMYSNIASLTGKDIQALGAYSLLANQLPV